MKSHCFLLVQMHFSSSRPHFTSLLSKLLILTAFGAIVVLTHLWNRSKYPRIDYDVLRPDVSASDWGLMGQRIRLLIKATELLVSKPYLDQEPVLAAISTQFPWFTGSHRSLYLPWKSPGTSRPGIVMCVGSSNYHMAAHLIANIRRVHGSSIAIEIAYAGDDDLDPRHRAFLYTIAHSITFVNLVDVFPHAQLDLSQSGWAMKPFALLAAQNAQTILVDADAIFLTTPDHLFHSHSGLISTGALFYHDRVIPGGLERQKYIQSQLRRAGVPPSDFLVNHSLMNSGQSWYEADSGLIAVDKSIPGVFLSLIFAAWMNTRNVREEFSYKMFHGDKETFWIAFELSGVPYTFDKLYAGSIGSVNWASDLYQELEAVELCSKHMLHMDESGDIPFWLNGGIYENKNKPELGYANLTHYWIDNGPRSEVAGAQWWWTEEDVACVREKGVNNIRDEIRATLLKTVDEASVLDKNIALIS